MLPLAPTVTENNTKKHDEDEESLDHDHAARVNNGGSETEFEFLTPIQTKNAKSLLKRVQEMPGFKLNESGEIILDGTRLYGSNISELVSDLVKD